MRIVAPAGSKERLYAAIKAGAEEIYMGLQGFGARRAAVNFTLEEYMEAIDYAHARGTRIFLTLNTMMMAEEMEFLYENVKRLYEYGLDAVIVQDLGLAKYLKKNFPDLELHGSTQLSVANHVEIEFLESLGFSRVVLPRELSFEEIKSIRKQTKMELEVFVSGALCISYSGNCYLSSFLGGRSGNRGMCAQACRKSYKEGSEEGFALSPKDQFYGKEEILALQEIGVESIKLEGRMKEPNYVFATVQYYKEIIEGGSPTERSSSLFNRGYSKGYFYTADESIMNPHFSSNIGERIGMLRGREVRLEKDVMLGDGLLFLSPKFEKLGGTYLNKIQVAGRRAPEKEKRATKGTILHLKDVPRGAKYLYRNYAKDLQDQIDQEKHREEKRKSIHMHAIAKLGEPFKLELWCMNEWGQRVEVDVEAETVIEAAAKRATTKEALLSKLEELGSTPFALGDAFLDIEDNLFLPASVIKQVKREGADLLEDRLILSYGGRRAAEPWKLEKEEVEEQDYELAFIVSKKEQKDFLEARGYDKIYYRSYDIAKEGELEKHDLDNPFAANLYQIIANHNEHGCVANWNLNIANRYTALALEALENLDVLMISPELSFTRIEKIGKIKQKKGLLAYSKLRAMYIDLDLSQGRDRVLENKEGDHFILEENKMGHSELILEEPLNILNEADNIKKLGIDLVFIEFTNENAGEMAAILEQTKTKRGPFRSYNYERGVY